MMWEEEESHKDNQLTIQWYEFQYSVVQRKSTAVFMLRLETAGAA